MTGPVDEWQVKWAQQSMSSVGNEILGIVLEWKLVPGDKECL